MTKGDKDEEIELIETPAGARDCRVRVTLVEEAEQKRPLQSLIPGKYKMGRFSSLEDFEEAEWRGEPEFDEPDGG